MKKQGKTRNNKEKPIFGLDSAWGPMVRQRTQKKTCRCIPPSKGPPRAPYAKKEGPLGPKILSIT